MAPKQDRTYAKIAELEARGLAAQAKASVAVRTAASRVQTKASGVVVPVFRSVEEVRALTGVDLLPRVDLPLDIMPLPACPGHKRAFQSDSHPVSGHCPSAGVSSKNAAVGAQGAHAHEVALLDASPVNPQAAVSSAIAGRMMPTLPEAAAPVALADAATVTALRPRPPQRPPGLPSPEVIAVGQEQVDCRPPAPKPTAPGPAPTGKTTLLGSTGSAPTAPGTPPEAPSVLCDPNTQGRILIQGDTVSIVPQSSTLDNASSNSGAGCAGGVQLLSPPPPRTPQPSAVAAGLQPVPTKKGYTEEANRSCMANVHMAGSLQQPQSQESSSRSADAPRQATEAADKSSSVYGAACAASGSRVAQDGGHNAASNTANVPYPVVGRQKLDSAFLEYNRQQHIHQLQLERIQQQQQQAKHQLHQLQYFQLQQRNLLLLQQQHMQQFRLYQLSQQENIRLQQLQQQVQVPQQRRKGGALLKQSHPDPEPPGGPGAHWPANPLRPPQRPRPCVAFGTDLKGVEATLTRALTSVFRKDPDLFRGIYGFDLDWWLDARGKPLGDAEDDLLVAFLFHNFAAVVVRADRGAAPAWAGQPQLLNPTISALLNEKVYGNVLLLRIFKRDGVKDGVIGSADGSGAALQVSSLTPSQVHALVLESDNVAWQMDWYKSLMPSLAESLSSDHREGWLSRLPLAPLNEQGNPDLRKALALVQDYFKIPLPVPRARTTGCGSDRGAVTTAASSTPPAAVCRGGRQQPSDSGSGVASGSRRDTADASRNEDVTELVPAEVAPLLKALRCTSPWCTPVWRRKAGSRHNGGHSTCPFGHFWRSLDLGEGSTTRTPVFDAARHWPSKPLEPELCPSLIDRLSQIGWAVVLPRMEAGAGAHGNALPQAPSADGIFAPGGSADSEGHEGNLEKRDTSKPAAGSRQLLPEDLTFYLSFCREGSRCRRCHSYYELNLAAALQRLTGVARSSRTGAAAPGQAQGRLPRLGFAVLANLQGPELYEEDTHDGGPSDKRSSSGVDASVASAQESGASPQATRSTSATTSIGDASTTFSSGFNWADEPESAEPDPKAVASAARTSGRASQPVPPRAYGNAPLMSELLRPQRLPPPLPMHGLSSAAPLPPLPPVPCAGNGSLEWSSRAPICCQEPSSGDSDSTVFRGAAERSLRRDLRPLPQLPETLDLEPMQARPDKTAVAASFTVKSRNGVYVPPHLRKPVDEETEKDEQKEGLKVSELLAAEAQSATAPAGQRTSSVEAQGVPPAAKEPQASLALATESSQMMAVVATEPQAPMPQAGDSVGPSPGEEFKLAAFSASNAKSSVSVTPVASLDSLMEAAQPPNHGMEGQQYLGIFPLQAQAQALAPPGPYQANPQVQEQPSVPVLVPVPVPVPVPLPAVQDASPQLQGALDGQCVAAATSFLPQHWPAASNSAHAPLVQPIPSGDMPSIEMDCTLGDCMSLCDLSFGGTPQAPPPSSAQQASLGNQGHVLAVDMYDTTAAPNDRPTFDGMPTPPPPAALYPALHMPARLGLQVHAPPFSLAHGPMEQGSAAHVPPTLFAAPPSAPSSLMQHSIPQSAPWVQQLQRPYAPPSLAPGPFGGGPPLYGTVPAGFQQLAFQPQYQPSFLPGWPSPLQPCAPPQALDNWLHS